MSRRIDTEIRIVAPPARVWRVLTDFAAYPDWNPFIVAVRGAAEPMTRLDVCIRMPDGREHRFKPVVLQATPERALRWLGRVGLPGIFDGEHGFFLEADGGGTRFRQTESFQGLLVPFLWWEVGSAVARGFAAMNAALKARVEGA